MKFINRIICYSAVGLLVLPMQESVLAKSWFRPLSLEKREAKFNIPQNFSSAQLKGAISLEEFDSAGSMNWHEFFSDPYLISLIETALSNNQEFNIFMQDIEIAKNEVKEKQGEYLPKIGLGFRGSRFNTPDNTFDGVVEKALDRDNLRHPNFDLKIGPSLTWEIDTWKKLRNAKEAARMRLMAKYEGRNYLLSRLVAEIARNYYELMALDNSLAIMDENIKIQNAAFLKMRELKKYAKSNQLAVNRFEAQLLKTKSMRFQISQKIVEKENRLRFLSGIYDEQPIRRDAAKLMEMKVDELQVGIPTQLLEYRPDIRQAEYEIKAAKLDLKSLKAYLYPSFTIDASTGFSTFDPGQIFASGSYSYDTLGTIMTPIINRKAIIARIQIADARQTQAVLNYEQTLLQAYTEVLNQMLNIRNLQHSFEAKQREVQLLDASIDIANSLFKYAKADYVEVLLTQEEKLSAQQDLLELKMNLIGSKVDLYRALGGGWR
ncbi:MAG: TolC family protein [Cyanobacteria bacterium]|nr:TolC family protein [Cyanobacteriota bacterium]